jgi:hypothetical protein
MDRWSEETRVTAEQFDTILGGVILAGLAGILVSLLWFAAAKLGHRSARNAGILAGFASLVYVGVGVAGAAIQGERPREPAAAAEPAATPPEPETKAPPEVPVVDPAVEQAAKRLQDAVVAGADWDAAASAHDALKALDAAHPTLAPAWAKIEAGRAAAVAAEGTAGESGGTGGETGADTDATDDGTTGAPEPAADEGGSTAAADDGSIELEPDKPRKKPKKKKRRRTPAADGGAADGGAADGGAADGGAPPEPEPEPEPEPAPAEG